MFKLASEREFLQERRQRMHDTCPHDIISQPEEFVKWCYLNQWGDVAGLRDYVRRYRLLYDLHWAMKGHRGPAKLSVAEYAAWEYLLGVKLLKQHETTHP